MSKQANIDARKIWGFEAPFPRLSVGWWKTARRGELHTAQTASRKAAGEMQGALPTHPESKLPGRTNNIKVAG
jgi:hypothetical protein